LTYSMQLLTIIDAMHKFTVTYPITLCLVHNDSLIAASSGQVVSQNGADMMSLIDGGLATRGATYLLWNASKPLEAVSTSWVV